MKVKSINNNQVHRNKGSNLSNSKPILEKKGSKMNGTGNKLDSSEVQELKLQDLNCPSFNVFNLDDHIMENELRPFFTLNNKMLCIPEKNRVEVFNVQSKLKTSIFKLPADVKVIAAGPLYHNPKQVFIACSDGRIHIRDLSNKSYTLEWNLNCDILNVKSTAASPNKIYILIKRETYNELLVIEFGKGVQQNKKNSMNKEIQEHMLYDSLQDIELNLLGSIQLNKYINNIELHSTIPSLGATVYNNPNISKKLDMDVYLLDLINFEVISISNKLDFFNFIRNEEQVPTNIAFHPIKPLISIIAMKGIIYQSELKSEKNFYKISGPCNVMHWHSLGANAICYTADGLSLLSGGNEAVLVNWTLSNKERMYVPRLRDNIKYICCSQDQSYYAIRYFDGAVSLIDPTTFQLKHTWSGPIQYNNDFSVVIEPNRNNLVLPGHEGNIDFYDLNIKRVIGSISTLSLNRIKDDLSKPIITQVQFTEDGEWMATFTKFDTLTSINMESFLQFWQWDRKQLKYLLISEIRNPHQQAIKSMCFYKHTLASISLDGSLKLWNYTKIENDIIHYNWNCNQQSYRNNCNPNYLNFSSDGSILSVTYEDKIALWDPITMTLQQYIACPSAGILYKSMFIPNTPFLVTIGQYSLVVFNLISGEIWWNLAISPSNLILNLHLNSKTFTIFAQDLLLTFNPISPTPIYATSLPFLPMNIINVNQFNNNNNNLNEIEDMIIISEDKLFCKAEKSIKDNNNNISSINIQDNNSAIIDIDDWSSVSIKLQSNNKTSNNKLNMNSINENTHKLSNELNRSLMLPGHLAPPVSQLASEFMLAMMQPLHKKKEVSNEMLDLMDNQQTIVNIKNIEEIENIQNEEVQLNEIITIDKLSEELNDLEFLNKVINS
ncbi:WD40 repeat-like protein [Neoconidiobolus thromboides FSU 785]|nr:WD40 repeat-like protein [Neoconidiobolus thromboides FSU 785]